MNAMDALLENLIDYAGLFPPASLDMATTVDNYLQAIAGDDHWMMNRLIIPASRLDEFEQAAAELLPRDPEYDEWHLSCLVAPAADTRSLAADLKRIAAFNQRHGDSANGGALIDLIECKADSAAAIDAAIDAIDEELFPFFEFPIDRDPRGLITSLVGADAGAKVRTGGVTPDLYPTTRDLARFIAACASVGVPFKATAGLHHPLYHRNRTIGADEFGFVGVFFGAALIVNEQIDEEELCELLEESDSTAFDISDEAIAWRGRELTPEMVEDARLAFAVSFGSCSFDEPRDDLRDLGWLE